MKGNNYWTTGITVKASHDDKWTASLDFLDDGFAEQGSTEGSLNTRYFEDSLSNAVDLMLQEIKKFNIKQKDPFLYYSEDGDDNPARSKDGASHAFEEYKVICRCQRHTECPDVVLSAVV